MNVSMTSLIIDAADLERESAFWHRLLGGSITETATHHFIRTDGFPVIVIQHAPGHEAPRWPDGTSQQMHFEQAVTISNSTGRMDSSSHPPRRGRR